MKPRERVLAALRHQEPDRVPRFEIWIDALFDALGEGDPVGAYASLGQDCVMMPTLTPPREQRLAERRGRMGPRLARRHVRRRRRRD